MSPSESARTVAVTRGRTPVVALLAVLALLSGCAGPPAPDTPQPATGVFEQMATNGIGVVSATSGDSGCNTPGQAPFAIHAAVRYPASSATTADVYLFTYADRGAWQRQAGPFEACRAAYASSSAAGGRAVGEMNVSPYRAFGAGWTSAFEAALRAALTEAAGNGG